MNVKVDRFCRIDFNIDININLMLIFLKPQSSYSYNNCVIIQERKGAFNH